MIDMLYSSTGNFKKGYGLMSAAPSVIYHNLVFHKEHNENMSHYRVCDINCLVKDVYKNSISSEEFIKKYEAEQYV